MIVIPVAVPGRSIGPAATSTPSFSKTLQERDVLGEVRLGEDRFAVRQRRPLGVEQRQPERTFAS